MPKPDKSSNTGREGDREPAFAERRRYFDGRLKKTVVRVLQGDYYVSSDPRELVTTILGSCIAVCMRDPAIGCGGMNHFLLPDAAHARDGLPSLELRYGSFSIERLINAIVCRGGRRDRLEIKVFGGANVLGTSNIGHHNADFVEAYLCKEGLAIAAKHVRGTSPRRVRYHPASGQVQMCEARDPTMATILAREARLRSEPAMIAATGGV
jgi:chemotaxis protein CheD